MRTLARAAAIRAPDHLTFEVRDDGAGFDVDARRHGTGLQAMADRLEAIGGELEVRSVLGTGTSVTGRVPASEVVA